MASYTMALVINSRYLGGYHGAPSSGSWCSRPHQKQVSARKKSRFVSVSTRPGMLPPVKSTRLNRPTRSKYSRGLLNIFTYSRQISAIHIHHPLSIGCRITFDWVYDRQGSERPFVFDIAGTELLVEYDLVRMRRQGKYASYDEP
jgi:hypothetical protein